VAALPVNWNLNAYRGDNWGQTFRLLQADAVTPVDLTGCTVASWAAREGNGQPPVILAVAVGPDPGTVTVKVPTSIPADTYAYDVEVTEPDGSVTTWVRGRLVVDQDVTNRL